MNRVWIVYLGQRRRSGRKTANYAFWSIGATALIACLVYVKFGLGSNRVMNICNWAFRPGYSAAKRATDTPFSF